MHTTSNKSVQESEERAEADELRERLTARKVELEEMLTELNTKLDEGEEQMEKLSEEKKKLQVGKCCLFEKEVFYSLFFVFRLISNKQLFLQKLLAAV